MRLGYVSISGRGQIDLLLARVVALLERQGLRLVGTVQTNTERDDRDFCDMDLRLLPNGGSVRISVDNGRHARGCRLNPEALEQSVLWVSQHLDGADLLVINKFGKMEAEGRGLCTMIGEALDRGMPVLVGVNGLNLPAFLEFSGGYAEELDPEPAEIASWCLAACRQPVGSHSV